jgi:DNA-binding PadR family transcriptional regulator
MRTTYETTDTNRHPHPHDMQGPSFRGRMRMMRWMAAQQRAAGAGWHPGPMAGEDGNPSGSGHRGPRGGRGFGPFGHHPHGGMPPFGPGGWAPRRGGRARRGDVRAAVLVLLAEEPRNGYQLISEIEQRSDGAWKPSPGSVYPVLSQLEDEDLVTATTVDGRKAFELTPAGREAVEARAGSPAPWDEAREAMGEGASDLMGGMRGLAAAAWQVAATGTTEQQRQAADVLDRARRDLYRLLADGDDRPTA